MPVHAPSLIGVDPRLLTRAGRAMQALQSWWVADPTDSHPTVGQLAAVGSTEFKTTQRGLKDLEAFGLLVVTRDPEHVVGRSLAWAPLGVEPMVRAEQAQTEPGPPNSSVTPELSDLLRSKDKTKVDVERGQVNFVTGQKDSQDRPMGDVLARFQARFNAQIAEEVHEANNSPKLANLGHLEKQGRLPLQAPADLKLMTAVKRLESGRAEDVEPVVIALKMQFGDPFELLYRKVCGSIQRGNRPFSALIEAIEEATRPGARHPGKSFCGAIRRTMPGLILAAKPTSESSRKDPSDAGRSAKGGTNQSTQRTAEVKSEHKNDYHSPTYRQSSN